MLAPGSQARCTPPQAGSRPVYTLPGSPLQCFRLAGGSRCHAVELNAVLCQFNSHRPGEVDQFSLGGPAAHVTGLALMSCSGKDVDEHPYLIIFATGGEERPASYDTAPVVSGVFNFRLVCQVDPAPVEDILPFPMERIDGGQRGPMDRLKISLRQPSMIRSLISINSPADSSLPFTQPTIG